MNVYDTFLRDARAPVLLREGFSIPAFLFGPFWLLLHAVWIPCLLLLAAGAVVFAALPGPYAIVVSVGLAWLTGLHGQDLRGWSLRRRGWQLAHVVAARNPDAALIRLLDEHPAYRTAISF